MFVDISFNKVHELAMVVTQCTLQCLYIFIAWNKNRQLEMRLRAQKPEQKGMCCSNNTTLSHHLLTLSTIHEDLELLRPKFWAAMLFVVSCWSVHWGKMTWLYSRTNMQVSIEPQETRVDRTASSSLTWTQAWTGLTVRNSQSTSRLVKVVSDSVQLDS